MQRGKSVAEVTDQPIETCIRRTLEIIRDELRLYSPKYEGLRHTKLSSPLPVSASGWEAFAGACRNDNSGEHWHVEINCGWVGQFRGQIEGVNKFDELVRIFSRLTGGSLLDVVHDFAVLDATPLLTAVPSIWNWEGDQNADENESTEDLNPLLKEWSDSSTKQARYPKHPITRELSGNVFFCAAVAIDLVLAPETLFLRRPYQPDDAPLTVGELTETENYWCPVSTQLTINSEEPEIEFLFHKSGDTWQIRYTSGATTEFGVFSDLKGLARYATLLQSPHRFISSMEFDATSNGDAVRSAITAQEATDGGGEVVGGHNDAADGHWDLTQGELRELKQGATEIERELTNEPDAKRQQQLRQELRRIQRSLFIGRDSSGLESRAQKAHRKIKTSLYNARAKLSKGNMPQLAAHLEAFIFSEGYGYVYRPDRQIHWTF